MQLPEPLQQAIEILAEKSKLKDLKSARTSLSEDYKKGDSSSRGFKDPSQLISYLITRMPATFAACTKVFQEMNARLPNFAPQTFLDLGAGPGTASWAALCAFSSLTKLHLMERELDAIEIGKQLAVSSGVELWRHAEWHNTSLEKPFPLFQADLAVLSYVFAEVEDLSIIDKLLDGPYAVVAVIEPGTPKGFERIRKIRAHVLARGAQLIAPCPHAKACPMSGSDWCHFPARVERTRLHRLLKEGTLGHEDEKYSYVVFSKNTISVIPFRGRVVRHPQKGSGHVRLSLCSSSGDLTQETATRSNKEVYRSAKNAEWGSSLI